MTLDRLEQRYVDVDGVAARALVLDGDGPTLVLLQPGSAVPEVFLPLFAELAGQFRIVAPDLPGHGATPYRRRPGTSPHGVLAAHVSMLLDALEVGRVVIGGSSLGAHIALLLALREPDRFRAVIPIGSASAFASEADFALVINGHNDDAAPWLDNSVASTDRSLRRYLVDPDLPIDHGLLWAQHASRTRPDVRASSAELFADLADIDLVRIDRVAERLAEVRQPALVLWGRRDAFADLAFAEANAPRLPHGRLEVLDDCGHLLYLEQPVATARLIAEFAGDYRS